MKKNNSIEDLSELKNKLKDKYPQLTDSDLRYNVGNETELLRMVAYKLKKTKQEIYSLIENL